MMTTRLLMLHAHSLFKGDFRSCKGLYILQQRTQLFETHYAQHRAASAAALYPASVIGGSSSGSSGSSSGDSNGDSSAD